MLCVSEPSFDGIFPQVVERNSCRYFFMSMEQTYIGSAHDDDQ